MPLRVQVFCSKQSPNCRACPLRHDCDYALAKGRHLDPGLVKPKKTAPKVSRKPSAAKKAPTLALPAADTASLSGADV